MSNKNQMVQYDCAPGVHTTGFDMKTSKDGKPLVVSVRGGCGKYSVPKEHVKKFESLTHIKKLFASGRITRTGGDLNSGGAAKGKSSAAPLPNTTTAPANESPATPASGRGRGSGGS